MFAIGRLAFFSMDLFTRKFCSLQFYSFITRIDTYVHMYVYCTIQLSICKDTCVRICILDYLCIALFRILRLLCINACILTVELLLRNCSQNYKLKKVRIQA